MQESTAMVAVKEERPDEAEIQALAEQIKEANRAKMAAPNRTGPTVTLTLNANGQTTMCMPQKTTPPAAKPAAAATQGLEEKKPIDEESLKGRFGWVTLGSVHIPYILRLGEKYCAVRMVENKILNKFLSYLHQNLYHYTNVRSYYITDAEARLINEINGRHCDSYFGREQFTNRDLVVRLHDAVEFYHFLEVCYNKVQYRSHPNPSDRCGFIRINNESVVPYTVKDGVKYVPLFYFEGETDSLKLKAETLEGWDLAYLKFCCKVQGIRNELFASETCSVISLDDIKSYFPSGTQFDDYWPPKLSECQLIAKNPVTNASWTKQPAGAPAAAKTTAAHGRAFPPITPPTAGTPGASAALPGNMWNNMLGPQHSAVPQQSIARMAQALAPNQQQQQQRTWQTNGTNNPYYYHQQLAMQQQQQQQQVQKAQPPPLIRSRPGHPQAQHMTANAVENGRTFGAIQKNVISNTTVSGSGTTRYNSYTIPADIMDLSAQQQSQFAMNAEMAKDPKIREIADITPKANSLGHPYQLQKIMVMDKLLPCINTSPYQYAGDVLTTVPDFVSNFCPDNSPMEVQKILQDVFKVTFYKGNRLMNDVLRASGRCRSDRDAPLLMQTTDVSSLLPQLRYVLTKKGEQMLQTPSEQNKRMRIS